MTESQVGGGDLWLSVSLLARLATDSLYAEQPELQALGVDAQKRVLEDFEHHFRALATLDSSVFSAHAEYCYGLFRERGFPRRWLDDAWRHMEIVLVEVLGQAPARSALDVLAAGVREYDSG